MESRVQRILSQCQNLGIEQDISLEEIALKLQRHEYSTSFYVDDAHKVIYCPIVKSASTTIKLLLMQSTGKRIKKLPLRKQLHDVGLKLLNDDYSVPEISRRLRNYLKLIVVRHPMHRLVSAHNHRFLLDWQYPRNIANFSDLTNVHFNRSLNTSPENKMDIYQFFELLTKEPSTFVDDNWLTYLDACHPCSIKYDKVIRLETFEDDIRPILERIDSKIGIYSPVPHYGRFRKGINEQNYDSRLYESIEMESIKDLMKTYGCDLAVFGYIYDRKKGIRCAFVNEDGKCC